jgi:hypothetical protein
MEGEGRRFTVDLKKVFDLLNEMSDVSMRQLAKRESNEKREYNKDLLIYL